MTNDHQRVALVTGGSRGIGRAIALQLGAAGTKVAVNYLAREDAAQEVVEAVKRQGGDAMAFQGDVTRTEDVEALIKGVENAWGAVDILVNNAGTIKDSLLIRMSIEDFDNVVALNLRGTFLCTRLVLRDMLRNRWGRVVNIGSVVGIAGNVGQSNYAASKSAVIGFTKSVAKEVASRNITVNCVAPGYITTDIVEDLPQELKGKILERIHMRRFGSVQEVADLVSFLVREEASYITGQVIAVDGGLSLGG
ncbi:MAG: 3-oxoacyl-[acyl-carrier-protein] reductase [Chloroflexota bacterium]|nr:3-oxoacyl-[acyl-carrier-protein] reductase [Chloroflexota bacterium]